jgi:hypothetical protein
LLSLPAGTEMFHFPALPSAALCIQAGTTPHDGCRVSPFGNPRINARLPAPRGLSQAPTSFIGSWCQDIHRMLLKTWLNHTSAGPRKQDPEIDARVHYAVLKIRTEPCGADPHPKIHAGRPFEEDAPSEAAAPSGPNSVPTQRRIPCARSAVPASGLPTDRALARQLSERVL